MPGGFGTLDEMFEAVTLMQTKKVKPFPVILVGDDGYWDGLIDWINEHHGDPRQGARGRGRRSSSARSTPQEVVKILKRQPRLPPKDRSGRSRAGRAGTLKGTTMSYTVTLIPGDGIGPEVVAAAVRVLTATGLDFQWETQIAGAAAIGEHGTALPPHVLDSIRKNKVALKGPTEHAGRHRAPLGQRRAAQDARPLRQPAAGADAARA